MLRAEEYYASYLYSELLDLQHYPSAEIGEYVKAFLHMVGKELEQQRLQDKLNREAI